MRLLEIKESKLVTFSLKLELKTKIPSKNRSLQFVHQRLFDTSTLFFFRESISIAFRKHKAKTILDGLFFSWTLRLLTLLLYPSLSMHCIYLNIYLVTSNAMRTLLFLLRFGKTTMLEKHLFSIFLCYYFFFFFKYIGSISK